MLLPSNMMGHAAGVGSLRRGFTRAELSIRVHCDAGVALSVRVASIPAVSPSPALSPNPKQHAPPTSAFAAATAVTDGGGMPADSADTLQTDAGPPSSAGAPDAESIDGALSAVTVSPSPSPPVLSSTLAGQS